MTTHLSDYMIRLPTDEEMEQAAKFVHEAVWAHREQVRRWFPKACTLVDHKSMPPWEECTTEQREESAWPIQRIVECKGLWLNCTIEPAYLACGCGAVGVTSARVVLMEMGILPEHVPDPRECRKPTRQEVTDALSGKGRKGDRRGLS